MKANTLWHINWGNGDNSYVIVPTKKAAINAMSEGRDMVNYVVKLDSIATEFFNAGYDKGLLHTADIATQQAYEAGRYIGRQEGRREVVEWIDEETHIEQSLTSITIDGATIDGAMYRVVSETRWQAFLKGLEGDKKRYSVSPPF